MQVNCGKSIVLDIDHAALPKAALEHAIMIGLRNILMDSHASITADEYPDASERESAARAMVDKKLAALMRGEVRVQSTREGDPVRAEAMRIAADIIKAALRKKGQKIADVDPKAIREAAGKLIERDATITERAKARVAEQKAASVDLSDLGL